MANSDEQNPQNPSATSRRALLKATAAAPLAPAISAQAAALQNSADQPHPPSGADARVRSYRTLGRTGLKVPDIAFGSSRLREGEENLVLDALDRGVTYFDTAESYTGGTSEQVIGRALKGKRDQVVITSKTFVPERKSRTELMADLDASLRRLQMDYVDIYMSHAVNDPIRIDNPEWHAFVDSAKQAGKIRFTGMSGHAGYLIECCDHALDNDLVDVLLLAYNFGQDESFWDSLTRRYDRIATQPDLPRILGKAKAQNVGVTVMKTLMGARLNDMRPYESGGATFAQAAFRWVLSNSNVDSLVISMTSQALIEEYLGASGASALQAGDLALLQQYARTSGLTYCRNACSDCDDSCPYGVPIPDVMRTRMYATDYRDVDFGRREYAMLDVNATACLSCDGAPCRDACTHGLAIDQLCAPTHRMLA